MDGRKHDKRVVVTATEINLPIDADETTPLVIGKEPSDETARNVTNAVIPAATTKASVNHLLLPFLLYCIAMGAVAVPKLNVILALFCVQYDSSASNTKISNDQICSTPPIHARMARFMMCANIISGVGCAISGPRIGALSDKYGRKPLLAFSALGLLFGDVISVIAGWFPHRISVYWVLLEFGIGGLTGSFGATMALVQTYAADCTTQAERASVFARLHACMYLGSALGPAAGAFYIRVVGNGDMLSVFYVASACHAAFIVFVLLGLRESLPQSARSRMKIRPVSGSEVATTSRFRDCLRACNVFRCLKILRPPRAHSSANARRNLPVLAGIDGVAFGTQLGLASVLILYAEYRLDWKTIDASLFVSLTNATRAIVLLLILPMAYQFASKHASKPCDNPSESTSTAIAMMFGIWTIRLAILFDVASHLGFATSRSTALFTMFGVLAAAAAPISPSIQSLMTRYVEPTRVGELLGTVSLLHAVGRCLIPALMQLVYSVTIRSAPNAVFVVLSVTFALTFLFSLLLRI